MNLAILFLALALQQPQPVQAPPVMSFAQMYDLQVDVTNEAVRAYGNASCTDSNFMQLTMRAKGEYAKLVDLHEHIPETEDEETRIKQTEVYIGLRFVTSKIAGRQNKCLSDNFAPKYHPQVMTPEGQ